MSTTKTQAATAAAFVRNFRTTWDEPLLASVIYELCEDYPYPDVVAAAIRTATNPDNKSPLSLKWPGNLPNAGQSSAGSGKYSHEPRCAICGLRFTRCRYMAGRTSDRHAFSETDN